MKNSYDVVASRPRSSRKRAAMTIALTGFTASTAIAQSLPAAEPAPEKMTSVVVTGTSIRGVAPTGSATLSIGAKDIAASGMTSTVDIVRSLPQIQNIGADETRTSGRDGAADNSGKGSAINLRGLGNNATLMLIDGHRIAPNGTASAFGDPNQIPAIALERIEVVTDGASGVYGSDAVAGVVNLILRKGYDGVLANATHTSNGKYHQSQFSALAGKDWDDGGFVVSYQYQDRSPMLQGARDYMRSDLRGLGGNDGRLNGTTTTPGPASGNIIAGSGATARLYGVPALASGVPTLGQITAAQNNLNLVDTSDYNDYLPAMKRHSATLYAERNFGDGYKVFAEGFYNRRDSELRIYPNAVSIALKPNTPFYVAGVPGASATTGYTVQYPLYSAFGPTVNTYPERSGALTAGLEKQLAGDWKAGSYATYSQTSLCNCTPLVNNTVLQALVDTGQFNPYITSAQPAAILSQFRDTARQAVRTRLADIGAKLDGPVMTLPAGAVRAAVGVEHTHSYQSLIRIGADRATSPAIPLGTPAPGVAFTSVPTAVLFASSNTESSRNIDAAYAELFVPVFGAANALPLVQRLDLSLALRHDRYSDVGSTTNPKVGATWKPTADLNVRASWGTSFRAPSLPESNPNVQGGVRSFSFANGSGDTAIGLTNVTNGTSNGIALDGGNSSLKPEKATTYSFGADFKPKWAPGLKLSATFYDVNYKDRIESLSGIFTTFLATPQNRALYAPFIVPAPQPATCVEGQQSTYNPLYLPYINNPNFVVSTLAQCSYRVIFNAQNANLGDLKQNGIDASFDYQFRNGGGDWQVGGSLTKILNLKRQLSPVSGLTDVLDTIQFPVSTRARATFGWRQGGLAANLFANYTGGYTNNAPITVAGVAQPVSQVPSWTTVDMSLSYDWGKAASMSMLNNVRLSLSAQNLLDREPPRVLSSASTFAFDSQNANPLGRVVTVSVTKGF
jgi:iron complex outermembrane receptor protein